MKISILKLLLFLLIARFQEINALRRSNRLQPWPLKIIASSKCINWPDWKQGTTIIHPFFYPTRIWIQWRGFLRCCTYIIWINRWWRIYFIWWFGRLRQFTIYDHQQNEARSWRWSELSWGGSRNDGSANSFCCYWTRISPSFNWHAKILAENETK